MAKKWIGPCGSAVLGRVLKRWFLLGLVHSLIRYSYYLLVLLAWVVFLVLYIPMLDRDPGLHQISRTFFFWILWKLVSCLWVNIRGWLERHMSSFNLQWRSEIVNETYNDNQKSSYTDYIHFNTTYNDDQKSSYTDYRVNYPYRHSLTTPEHTVFVCVDQCFEFYQGVYLSDTFTLTTSK